MQQLVDLYYLLLHLLDQLQVLVQDKLPSSIFFVTLELHLFEYVVQMFSVPCKIGAAFFFFQHTPVSVRCK